MRWKCDELPNTRMSGGNEWFGNGEAAKPADDFPRRADADRASKRLILIHTASRLKSIVRVPVKRRI